MSTERRKKREERQILPKYNHWYDEFVFCEINNRSAEIGFWRRFPEAEIKAEEIINRWNNFVHFWNNDPKKILELDPKIMSKRIKEFREKSNEALWVSYMSKLSQDKFKLTIDNSKLVEIYKKQPYPADLMEKYTEREFLLRKYQLKTLRKYIFRHHFKYYFKWIMRQLSGFLIEIMPQKQSSLCKQ